MTAHRRTRKNQSKRSTTDVDPYTQRYRAASDAAKAARAAARSGAEGAGRASGEGLGREAQADRREERVEEAPSIIRIGEGARIRSVSLVSEGGTGYILEVGGEEHEKALAFKHAAAELVVPEVDWSKVEQPERFVEFHPDHIDWSRYNDLREEALRPEAAPHAAVVGQRGSEGASAELPEDAAPEPAAVGEAHFAFFEAEVNGLPTHVDTQDCTCEIGEAHWIELGEN